MLALIFHGLIWGCTDRHASILSPLRGRLPSLIRMRLMISVLQEKSMSLPRVWLRQSPIGGRLARENAPTIYDERSAMSDRFHWARLLAFVTASSIKNCCFLEHYQARKKSPRPRQSLALPRFCFAYARSTKANPLSRAARRLTQVLRPRA